LLKLEINTEYCKGCGICVAFCPKEVLKLDQQQKVYAASENECIACKQCELFCPDYAIEVNEESINGQEVR
jgi:2-oxoglutarate ferredoxin oxidoreductase subunit delta